MRGAVLGRFVLVGVLVVPAVVSFGCGGGGGGGGGGAGYTANFLNTQVLSSVDNPDPATSGQVVRVRFEVQDLNGNPINDLDVPDKATSTAGDFRIQEAAPNGPFVPLSSENLANGDTFLQPIRVVMLLDTSLSMETAQVLDDMKSAALTFLQDLRAEEIARVGSDSQVFEITVFQFSNLVTKVGFPVGSVPTNTDGTVNLSDPALNLVTIDPAVNVGPVVSAIAAIHTGISGTTASGDRTALYSAIKQAAILSTGQTTDRLVTVLFTDGADNNSDASALPPSIRVNGPGALQQVVDEIRARNVLVHAIGFNEVLQEQDKEGVPGEASLRAVSEQIVDSNGLPRGTFRSTTNASQIGTLFREIAQRVTSTYTVVVETLNQAGTLQFELLPSSGHTGTSPTLTFNSSIGGGGGGGGTVDDHSNQTAGATFVSVGSTTPGRIGVVGDRDYFTFTTGSAGNHVVETASSIDTFVTVFDGGGQLINSDDDSGAGLNGRVTILLPAGQQFFVEIRHFDSSGLGDYDLVVSGP
jgi:hypothetical protein